MRPPGFSAEEAVASQQHIHLHNGSPQQHLHLHNGSPLDKDTLTPAVSPPPPFPPSKSGRNSTFSGAEECLASTSALVAYVAQGTPQSHIRVIDTKGSPEQVKNTADEHEKESTAESAASTSREAARKTALNSVEAPSSSSVSENYTIFPPLESVCRYSAASEGGRSSAEDVCSAAFHAYKRKSCPPSALPCISPSESTTKKDGDASAAKGHTGVTERLPQAATSPNSSTTSLLLEGATSCAVRATARPAAPIAGAPATAPVVSAEEKVYRYLADGLLHAPPPTNKKEEEKEEEGERYAAMPARAAAAAAVADSPAGEQHTSTRSSGKEHHRGCGDTTNGISHLNAAVDVLLAHAEEQDEKIKRLTLLVEDVSLKLESLHEGLLAGQYVGVRVPPPAAAELLTGAPAATEWRRPRGRMIPPPLPRERERARTSTLCTAEQHRVPSSTYYGNSATST